MVFDNYPQITIFGQGDREHTMDLVTGTKGNDELDRTASSDFIVASKGNNTIDCGNGNGLIFVVSKKPLA